MPENSIQGFKHAIDLGADGIELDVVVNKDKQLVISHEPYFQSEFCYGPDGAQITSEKMFNIYEMTQEEIRKFDCGSKGNKNYPEQERLAMNKPLLSELFETVDLKKSEILFEIKSNPKEYGVSQPEPKEYLEIIMKELDSFPYFANITFMSFDKEILEELKLRADEENRLKNGHELKTVYLTYLPFRSAKKFLKDLSFKPSALGMFYPTVNRKKAHYLHKREIKLYTWTVNDPGKADLLKRKGVDGIITDYPNIVK
jgi:glycerophosphoryl diester phosphodiesterase